jgi:hypothetical protein
MAEESGTAHSVTKSRFREPKENSKMVPTATRVLMFMKMCRSWMRI